MDLSVKLSFMVFLVCLFFSVKNQDATSDTWAQSNIVGNELHSVAGEQEVLRYDYYSVLCPTAESIIRSNVKDLYAADKTVAPALLRLLFHDCFHYQVGCDASIMLDSNGRIQSEKDSVPNKSLRGFEQMDIIKSKLEEICPGVVSCADILAVAARESVLLVGGQFYPVFTGRKDSRDAFQQNAAQDIPHPEFDVKQAIQSFASRGFDATETVALIGGGHSTGNIHCSFIHERIFNFNETLEADPSINVEFLEVLRSECSHSSSFENRALKMDYEGPGKDFGKVYYRSLLQGKGLLFVDQQLTTRQDTKAWIDSYLSDITSFNKDFGRAMMKLSHLTTPNKGGEVRRNCRKVNSDA